MNGKKQCNGISFLRMDSVKVLDGILRIQESVVDMGAYEFIPDCAVGKYVVNATCPPSRRWSGAGGGVSSVAV